MKKPAANYFVFTRKILRGTIRKRYGNKAMKQVWTNYQEEHKGKRKTFTELRPV